MSGKPMSDERLLSKTPHKYIVKLLELYDLHTSGTKGLEHQHFLTALMDEDTLYKQKKTYKDRNLQPFKQFLRSGNNLFYNTKTVECLKRGVLKSSGQLGKALIQLWEHDLIKKKPKKGTEDIPKSYEYQLSRKYYSNKIRKRRKDRLNQWHHEFLLSKLDVAIALKDRSMIKSMMNLSNIEGWVLCGFNEEMLRNLPDSDKNTLSACLEQIVCNLKTIADIKNRNLGNDIAAISYSNYGVGFYQHISV